MADVTVLDVLLYGAPVATLTRVSDDRILFAFNEAFIADDNRPTLGLGFKDRLGELITNFRPNRHDDLGPATRHDGAGPASSRRQRHPQSARRPWQADRVGACHSTI